MSFHGLMPLLAVAALTIAEGCRVPPVPEHIRAQASAGEPEEGIPLDRILGVAGE